jgi:hypothetical protein
MAAGIRAATAARSLCCQRPRLTTCTRANHELAWLRSKPKQPLLPAPLQLPSPGGAALTAFLVQGKPHHHGPPSSRPPPRSPTQGGATCPCPCSCSRLSSSATVRASVYHGKLCARQAATCGCIGCSAAASQQQASAASGAALAEARAGSGTRASARTAAGRPAVPQGTSTAAHLHGAQAALEEQAPKLYLQVVLLQDVGVHLLSGVADLRGWSGRSQGRSRAVGWHGGMRACGMQACARCRQCATLGDAAQPGPQPPGEGGGGLGLERSRRVQTLPTSGLLHAKQAPPLVQPTCSPVLPSCT